MFKKNALQKFTKIIQKNNLMVVLSAALIVTIVAINVFGRTAERPLRIELVNDPIAYCAFTLLESKDPRYIVSLADGYDAIIRALQDGAIDAALLPVEYLKELREEAYTVVAVTSYTNLVAVENGGSASSIYDLEGRSVVMPSSVQGTPALRILHTLFLEVNIPANIVFESEDAVWERAQEGNFDIMILPIKQCAPVLLHSAQYRSCFNLADQWKILLDPLPPAGGCIIVRTACMEEKRREIADFLSAIKASINFIDTKHKKAAMLIAANGLGEDSMYIWKTLPHCMFRFLEGQDMEEALDQFTRLEAMQ